MNIQKKSLLNNNFRENILIIMSSALLLTVTLFFFGPLEILLSAASEFWFGAGDVFWLIAGLFVVVFAGVMLFSWMFSKLGKIPLRIWVSVVSGFGLALYIQGNWTFIDYGLMDGRAIDWKSYGMVSVTNTILWIVIFLIVIALFVIKPQFIKLKNFIKFNACRIVLKNERIIIELIY